MLHPQGEDQTHAVKNLVDNPLDKKKPEPEALSPEELEKVKEKEKKLQESQEKQKKALEASKDEKAKKEKEEAQKAQEKKDTADKLAAQKQENKLANENSIKDA